MINALPTDMANRINPTLLALVDSLSLAITVDNPCGNSIRHDVVYDAIREARRQDDASLPTGVWQSAIKEADWLAVERLARAALAEQSKDLMVGAWLGEAWLQRYGLEGLAAILLLLGNWCELWWAELHPLAEEGDQSWRASPLEWLARTYSTTLHAGVHLPGVPLLDNSRITLDQYLLWQRQGMPATDHDAARASAEAASLGLKQLRDALKTSGLSVLEAELQRIGTCRALLQRLDDLCSPRMGVDGVSFNALFKVFEQLEQVLRELMPQLRQPEVPPDLIEAASVDLAAPTGETRTVPPARGGQVAASRDDAYQQLKKLADYLACTEPHSPVPYLIYQAVEWGSKPLPALLGELLSADAEARRVWALLGILPAERA